MRRILAVLPVVVVAVWPALASAARLSEQEAGPQVGTLVDGFTEVMGPSATEPEHAYQFIVPPPEPCPYCPAQPAPRPPPGLH